MGDEAMTKYGRHLSEKVLRLFDEALSQEKFCSLREDWESSEVEPGDIVHITGMTIEHIHKWCPICYSFIFMLISPPSLISPHSFEFCTY